VLIPVFLGTIYKTSYCVHQASILSFHLTISGQDKIYSGSDEYVMGLEKAIRNAHEVARNKLNST
jgi:hypothetical protein